jgi:hypothetical protein
MQVTVIQILSKQAETGVIFSIALIRSQASCMTHISCPLFYSSKMVLMSCPSIQNSNTFQMTALILRHIAVIAVLALIRDNRVWVLVSIFNMSHNYEFKY